MYDKYYIYILPHLNSSLFYLTVRYLYYFKICMKSVGHEYAAKKFVTAVIISSSFQIQAYT